ncbi:galactose mutarotase-like protein [Calocera viscosa TUFC12733]|uniref:glucose-6-phosphate 1-epimerase n=1 Tax=Calocera viscosa (strain TUFC12733) TaxID=1330018 RepID=A0A167K8A5_CALVF|nr:galactose mutarotase-like protein [Calocera viscosa TUFC12733]
MPVDIQPNRVVLHHPAGASATILLYGATVISWISGSHSALASASGLAGPAPPAPTAPLGAAAQFTSSTPAAPSERLFVSALASLDGSKPVRGGIPICWPIFGPPSREEYKALKQHGFARSSVWTYAETVLDAAEGVSGRFVLESSEQTEKLFPHPFKLVYTVTLAEHQLTTSLRVYNTGTAPLAFQALLHNYFRGEAASAGVQPLKGVRFVDKVRDGARDTEAREIVDVRSYTDRVYEAAGGAYTLTFPPSAHLSIKTHNLPDVTVWNPQETGSGMADMEPGGWERYVCVEPGHVARFVSLEPGGEWWGQQNAMDRFEQLILAGDLFGDATPASPPRTPSTLSPASSRSPSPSLPPNPHASSVQVGQGVPGRTGVKGVIRDAREANQIERERKSRELGERQKVWEEKGRGALSFREESEGKGRKMIRVAGEEKLAEGARKRFGHLREVGVEGFVDAVEEKDAWVVVHIYDPDVEACHSLDTTLALLARAYPHTKFLRARATTLGFASLLSAPSASADRTTRLDDLPEDEEWEYEEEEQDEVDLEMLPTMLVYKAGELRETWIRVDWEARDAGGVEQLLVKNGIIPSASGKQEDDDDSDWD